MARGRFKGEEGLSREVEFGEGLIREGYLKRGGDNTPLHRPPFLLSRLVRLSRFGIGLRIGPRLGLPTPPHLRRVLPTVSVLDWPSSALFSWAVRKSTPATVT